MASVPATLRAKTVEPWIPTLAMTATLRVNQMTQMQKLFCINDAKCVKIILSPVQPQHMIFNIERPNTFYGDEAKGVLGTKHLLDRLLLKEFDKCMLNNDFENFQKTIIFVKNVVEGIQIGTLLTHRYKTVPINQRPWIVYHSKTLNVTNAHTYKKCDNDMLKLIITTPRVLMGVNLPKFRKVIMLGPYSKLSDITQAVGRTGRREEGGRAQSILYNCWNNKDLYRNTSDDVVSFCKSKECLKSVLHEHFTNHYKTFGGKWCCNNCSL